MEEVLEKLRLLEKGLKENKLIVVEKFELDDQPVSDSLLTAQRELSRIEPSVLDFYEVVNGLTIDWKPVDTKYVKQEMLGRTKVNPFLQVVTDWNGVVFFDSDAQDSERRTFFPLDFFIDEAAVGFNTKEASRKMLYLYQFEGDMIPLYVNFKSYLELLVYAKGCLYWQYLIREITEQKENVVSARIKQYLPQLFPDFSFEGFEKLFTRLRIKS